jgi:hypothetical protein
MKETRKHPWWSPLFVALLAGGFALGSLPIVWEGCSQSWSFTSGRIRSVQPGEEVYSGRSHKHGYAVSYDFEVDGKTYRGTRGSLSSDSTPRELKVGEEVGLYYVASDPEEAVLDLDWEYPTFMLLWQGLLALVCLRLAFQARKQSG